MTDMIEHDVLIVGVGGAGLRAAIAIAEADTSLTIAVVSNHQSARSSFENRLSSACKTKKSTEMHWCRRTT